ncbi:MAG: RNA polymerase sigma factor [Chloroflexi bacterium]|nr:RNA polymerase sigma factor [Chloroflexota bacterium]
MAPLDPKSRSEQDLLLRLKNGDEHAWSFVTQEYGTRLYNFLLKKLPTAEDVEDVLMETMAAAVRSIGTFDGKASLSTFLFSLANHKRVDFYRRHQKTVELTEMVVDRNSGTASVEFQELLNELRPEYREILLLRYQTGLGVDEIATLIGKNYKSTESLLSRARQELRKAMGKSDDDDDE